MSTLQKRVSYPAQNVNIIIKLWCAGAAGSLVGYGLIFPAYISISIILITNLLFPAPEKNFNPYTEKETVNDLQKAEIVQIIEPIIPQETYYPCHVNCSAVDEAEVLALLVQLGKEQQLTPTKISSRNLDNNLSSPEIEVQIDFVSDSNSSPLELQQILISLKSKLKVMSASWSEIGKNNQSSSVLKQDNPKN